MTYRSPLGYGHAFRHKYEDMAMTKKYHADNPPKVGDKVVVLKTYSHSQMLDPEFCVIEAITDRGRIVVDHRDARWGLAGKSFYKSGQNCTKPKGQIWLIPEALYEADYLSLEEMMKERHGQKEKTPMERQIKSEEDCLNSARVRASAKFKDLPKSEQQRLTGKALMKMLGYSS